MFDQEGAPLADSGSDYRLPKTVVPKRYAIRLIPDLEKFTFSGEESVAITVSESTSEILSLIHI